MAFRVSKVTGCPSRATRGGPIRLISSAISATITPIETIS